MSYLSLLQTRKPGGEGAQRRIAVGDGTTVYLGAAGPQSLSS